MGGDRECIKQKCKVGKGEVNVFSFAPSGIITLLQIGGRYDPHTASFVPTGLVRLGMPFPTVETVG